MIANNEKPGWSFYPKWVVLNAVTIVIAAVIAWALVLLIQSIVGGTLQIAGQTHITEDFLLIYALLPIIGVLTGLIQYALLRHYLPDMARWIAATLLGWLLPLIIGVILTLLFPHGFNLSNSWQAPGLATIGLLIALPQWWLLRKRVHHAAWWILANGIGWAIIGFLNQLSAEPFIVLSAVALIPALATGAACWLLL